MMRTKPSWLAVGILLSLFAISLLLRLHFFSGLILGDDPNNFGVVDYVLDHGPVFRGIVQMRWTKWVVQVAVMKVLGVSEASFFLPIWVLSSSLSVLGYGLLRRWGYAVGEAWLAGAFIATAPFEILSGALLTNDLFMTWPLNAALLVLVRLQRRPVMQGTIVAILLWLAFHGKASAICALPMAGLYYGLQGMRHGVWRGGVTCAVVSAGLHGLTALFWKVTLGEFFPILKYLSPTYPIAPQDIPKLLFVYPRLLFQGSSEFGTTLFGIVPYLVVILLLAKVFVSAVPRWRSCPMAFDSWDTFLGVYYVTWFLFLNFASEALRVDHYYSVGRIFRYLTPLSFPMTLHTGKMMLDLARWRSAASCRAPSLAALVLVPCLAVNVWTAANATRPGKIFRTNLLAVVEDIKRQCPPEVLAEYWVAYFLKTVYLRNACATPIEIPCFAPSELDTAEQHEAWLTAHEATLPEGTLLITGLANYVHYGCHGCGFRLRRFRHPLSARWKLVRTYGLLSYLPLPELVRVWRLVKPAEEPAAAR